MIWLMGVDSWNEKQISGIVDMEGPEYFNFVSRQGQVVPTIYFDCGYPKKDFTNGLHFREVVRKYNAYIKFSKEPIRVRSLDYVDLIGLCRQCFPGAETIY